MDTETLALLGQSAEESATGPDPGSTDPSDQGQQETETPEALIARGEIPEGYTKDAKTGVIRPKKTRGRPRKGTPPPAPDKPLQRGQDEAPNSKNKGKVKEPAPRWSKGVIAAGMTKLYRRAGKIIKAMDRDIGIAVIESAEDCGEAWDELARTNPRVRAFLMKLISGGAWGSVLFAHLPILMAIIMKDGIRKHIPFMRLIDSVMEPDEGDEGNPLNGFLAGMTEEDMGQMVQMAQGLMGNMARTVPGTVVRGTSDE